MKRLLLIPCAALLIGMLPNVASARTNWFFGLNFGGPFNSFSYGYGRHGSGFGFSLALPPPVYYSYPPTAYYSAPAYAPPAYYAAPAYGAPPVYYAPAPAYVPSTYFYYNSGYGYPRYYDRDDRGWGGRYYYRH